MPTGQDWFAMYDGAADTAAQLVEIVRDKGTKESFDPQAGVAAYLVRRAQQHGAILRNMPGDIVAFCPPLVISESEIDELLGCFGRALDDTWKMVRERNLV